jgi:uncharacterized protein YigE (DUF2233 family)
VLRINPRTAEIVTVTPTSQLDIRNQAGYSYSLHDLAYKTGALALSNAGPTSNFNIPIPDGLLRTNGVQVSPLKENHAGGGVFCVTGNGQADIVGLEVSTSSPQSFDRCRSAVQAGPLLIVKGKPVSKTVSPASDQQRWARTVVAVDSSGRVLLIVSDPVTLAELSDRLLQMTFAAPIDSALNLDGGFSSGLIYQSADFVLQQVGNTKTLIGSAILVKPGGGSPRSGNTVIVPAKEKWTTTLVTVQQGETISFSATGEIQWSNGKDARVGPNGSTWKLKAKLGSYPVRTMGAGGLIGKIGANGAAFAVGERMTITASESGPVYLGINDNFFTENSGNFKVTITKQ